MDFDELERGYLKTVLSRYREVHEQGGFLPRYMLELLASRCARSLLVLDAIDLQLVLSSSLTFNLPVALWRPLVEERLDIVENVVVDALWSRDSNIRERVCALLGDLSAFEIFWSKLPELLADPYLNVQFAARATLERFAKQGYKQALLKFRSRVPEDMMKIPEGEFVMGTKQGQQDEQPVHNIWLGGFFMDIYPVTRIQYARFLESKYPDRFPDWMNRTSLQDKGDHPVIKVSWYEALEFAEWAGKRLVTEAEWEKAASWNPSSGSKTRYPWGNQFCVEKCNTCVSGIGSTTSVTRYPQGKSWYGVYDMVGNVWEYCSTQKRSYPYTLDDGREDLDVRGRRVLRGGSWDHRPDDATCTRRGRCSPNNRQVDLGFRCALTIDQVEELME